MTGEHGGKIDDVGGRSVSGYINNKLGGFLSGIFCSIVLIVVLSGCGKTSPTQTEQTTPMTQHEPFDIEPFGIDKLPFSLWQKQAIERAIQKWEAIIVEGVPDFDYRGSSFDDVVISFKYAKENSPEGYLAEANGIYYRPEPPRFPYFGVVTIYPELLTDAQYNTPGFWELLITHEIGHVLGFYQSMLERIGTETTQEGRYFTGPKTCQRYREFLYLEKGKGSAYAIPNLRVPLMPDPKNSHWLHPVLQWDVMTPHLAPDTVVTAVTIAAFADMGYVVDGSQAKAPSRRLTKPTIGPRAVCNGQHVTIDRGGI